MIVAEPYQELEDIAIRQFGTAEGIIALAKANGLGLDAAIQSGQSFSVPVFTQLESDPELLKPYVLPVTEVKTRLVTYQNITDMAVQHYGSADALVAMCKLNGLALDDELAAGTELRIGNPVRLSMTRYFKEKNKHVVTGRDVDAGSSGEDGGIFDDSFDFTFE
jgi:hypothetical protein